MKAEPHPRQSDRLRALQRYDVLDTPREADFDAIVALASRICRAPISVINLIDADRQWFKAEVGLGVRETPLDTSLCAHAILADDFVEIHDTLADPRMADNPLCRTEPGLRFYAGALLRTAEGLPLGTLCVLDTVPRDLDALQIEAMKVLARQVMTQLDLRLALRRQEALRKEGDHRVKNSLASVAALVRLRAKRAAAPDTRDALAEVGRQIDTVGMLHAMMYRTGGEGRIDLAAYLERVVALLDHAKPETVVLSSAFAPVMVVPRVAAAAAMIVNELCANAFRHAFPDARAGRIEISGRAGVQGYVLTVEDDGVGMGDVASEATGPGGIGRSIVAAAVEETGGSLAFSAGPSGGVCVRVTLRP